MCEVLLPQLGFVQDCNVGRTKKRENNLHSLAVLLGGGGETRAKKGQNRKRPARAIYPPQAPRSFATHCHGFTALFVHVSPQ